MSSNLQILASFVTVVKALDLHKFNK